MVRLRPIRGKKRPRGEGNGIMPFRLSLGSSGDRGRGFVPLSPGNFPEDAGERERCPA